jgi:hypothetical protein
VLHEKLPFVDAINSSVAQTLYECSVSSPLPEALLAVNHILRSITKKAGGNLFAIQYIDDKTVEALLWEPLHERTTPAWTIGMNDFSKLNASSPSFLEDYLALRTTRFASPQAELVWLDFAQLCQIYRSRRGTRMALQTGLYFTDQVESPAESLLVARCAQLGFHIPLLQVSILDPETGRHLGRVDGLWPSDATREGLFEADTKYGRLIYSRQFGDKDSVVIEFDGRQKYEEDYITVLEKERARQNDIINLGFPLIRIGWSDLMQPSRLHSILTNARVPRAQRLPSLP